MQISRRDASRVVEVAAELRQIASPTAWEAVALRRALTFLNAELAGMNSVDRSSATAELTLVPDRVSHPSAVLRSVMFDHPLIDHYMTSGSTAPIRLSDVVGGSDRSLIKSRLYSELLRHTGIRQLVLPIRVEAPTGGLAMTVHRSGSDFTSADIDRAYALQIALVGALPKDQVVQAGQDSAPEDDGPVPPRPTGAAMITERQWAVLYLLARGESVGAVADRYVISRHTVTTHRRDAYARLGLSNIREASLWIASTLRRRERPLEDRVASHLAR